MNTHEYAQHILPIVKAAAEGLPIQMFIEATDEWADLTLNACFMEGCEYRIKPTYITINGFTIEGPLTMEPAIGRFYFVPAFTSKRLVKAFRWANSPMDSTILKRGIMHKTYGNALAHAHALLGIAPCKDEPNYENF